VHALPVGGGAVVPAAEVEDPVDDVEEDLALEGEPALACLAEGRVRRDDDLSQELVVVVVEGKRDHVRRPLDREEVPVEAGHGLVADEGDREPAPLAPLPDQDEGGERDEALPVGAVAPLLVRDLDARHCAPGV